MQEAPATATTRQTPYSVRELGAARADMEQWQAFAKRWGTIYHDLAWRTLFTETFGYDSHLLMAFDAAGNVAGILPLYRVPSLFAKPRLVAVPFRDRGGIAAKDDVATAALARAARDLMEKTNAGSVEIKSIEPYPEAVAAECGLRMTMHWRHSRVELAGLDETSLARALGAKMRIVRQGMRAGLVFDDKTHEANAVDIWHGIYVASQRNLGVPAFPKAFFARMLELLIPKSAISLFVVSTPQAKPLAATLVLHDAQASIYAYSASHPAGRHSRPNDLMLYNLYLRLIAQGRTVFDFGADSPGQDGLLRFKRKWLAKQEVIPFYYYGAGEPSAADSSARRYTLARRIIRGTPAGISNLALSPLVRYFG